MEDKSFKEFYISGAPEVVMRVMVARIGDQGASSQDRSRAASLALELGLLQSGVAGLAISAFHSYLGLLAHD